MEDVAKAINEKTGDTVVAYSWIDKSATEFSLSNEVAAKSCTNAQRMGVTLAQQLGVAIGANTASLHMVGHSHGALVSTVATIELKKAGLDVDHLTLLDSPENRGPASNNLDSWLENIQIGKNTAYGDTFVDNYYTSFGRIYNTGANEKLRNIVDASLNDPNMGLSVYANHSYPKEWYADATRQTSTYGVWLSPLEGNLYTLLDSTLYRKQAHAIALDSLPGHPYGIKHSLAMTDLYSDANAGQVPGGHLFTEASPAFWDAAFTKDALDEALLFDFQFLNVGDGDQLGIWIDDELRFLVNGYSMGTNLTSAVVDISDLSPGDHMITTALHSYGDPNAQFFISDFSVLSAPEPTTGLLILAGAPLLFQRRLRQNKAR
jgi:hypothetical protein